MAANRIAYLKLKSQNWKGGELFRELAFGFGCGETERYLSLMRKPSYGALDEILSDCEVSRGGGDIPTTCTSSVFHFLFSLL